MESVINHCIIPMLVELIELRLCSWLILGVQARTPRFRYRPNISIVAAVHGSLAILTRVRVSRKNLNLAHVKQASVAGHGSVGGFVGSMS